MPSKRKLDYARNEIALAQAMLSKNPDNEVQKDRLAWWSAYLGDMETARANAVSDKVKEFVESCET